MFIRAVVLTPLAAVRQRDLSVAPEEPLALFGEHRHARETRARTPAFQGSAAPVRRADAHRPVVAAMLRLLQLPLPKAHARCPARPCLHHQYTAQLPV